MHRFVARALLILALCALTLAEISQAQGLVINELMASNKQTLADEDLEFPDWIELYNSGTEPVNLRDYTLTDNPDVPARWRLPAYQLGPDQHYLIFASGKNRSGGDGIWHTVIDYGHTFKYHYGSSPALWTARTFDDSGWSEGPSPLGYERDAVGAEIATEVPEGTITLYLRTTFTVQNIEDVINAVLHVDYDDAFIAYLNGSEIARGNMPSNLSHDSPAPGNHEAVIYSGGVPERFEIPDIASRLRTGENSLAIRVHNVSAGSSDLTVIPFLTLAHTTEPAGGATQSEYLPPNLDTRPHTNFSLDTAGEYVILADTQGVVADSIAFSALAADVSIGRKPDGGAEWVTFLQPTPGSANITEGYVGDPLIAPRFSLPAGKYPGTIAVSLSSPEGTPIYYTTDGTPPTAQSQRYNGAISVSSTTTIQARAISPGRLPSLIQTQTFLINENSTIPVVAITTDPPNLWDQHTGIHVPGANYDPQAPDPHREANYWLDREIPVHVEMFEPSGARVISQGAGVTIFGAWSRMRPQKSLALFARSDYGTAGFRYRIFPLRNYDRFHSIVLRNSGNDANQLHFIDAYMQELVHHTGMETLAYRAAHVYLNGEYWGILNLREKANEHHAAARFGFDPDSIDVLEMSGGTAIAAEGTTDAWNQLIAYLNQNNIADDEVFEEVSRRVDIDNFIDYQITQIYLGNTDWPGNNHKFWRPQRPDGKFRWILYDTDFGFGSNTSYNHNTLAFATASNGPDWPNPPGATFLLRTLLRNETFKNRFINRFADHLNYTFVPDRMEAILDSMAAIVEPEIQRHFTRWGGSMPGWRGKQSAMKTWGRQRTPYMWGLLRSFFGLRPAQQLTVDTENAAQGVVRVNLHLPDSYPWTGSYFQGVSPRIEAVPRPGYRFVEWTGTSSSTSPVLTPDMTYGVDVVAHFEIDDSQTAPIRISEIHYHPADNQASGDWVELFNPMPFEVDISGWIFKDEDPSHAFHLPSGTIMPAKGYLVLAEDLSLFSGAYPSVTNVLGSLDFAFSNSGELLQLLTPSGEVVNEVRYTDEPPWPKAADGNGPTLELANLVDDNQNPRFWFSSSAMGGTPGYENSVAVPVSTPGKPELPREIALEAAYPNPFTSSTAIPFSLPESGHVEIRVYNALGQMVGTVIDAVLSAGYHEVVWEVGNEASGAYFYELLVDGNRRGTGTAIRIR